MFLGYFHPPTEKHHAFSMSVETRQTDTHTKIVRRVCVCNKNKEGRVKKEEGVPVSYPKGN